VAFRTILRECTPPILVRAVRSALRPSGDPVVRKTVRGVELLMRDSHNLPRYVDQHPLYDTALPAFVRLLVEELGRPIFIVDVGANIGDTAALVAAAAGADNIFFLCVEADDEFFPFLKENTKGLKVQTVHAIAGADNRVALAETRSTGGTSAVVLGSGESKNVVRIDDVIAGRSVDLIKTDTDGFEYEVLKGLSDTLTKQAPYLFVEFHPPLLRQYGNVDPSAVASLLLAYNYCWALAYDNLGNPMGLFDLNGEQFRYLVRYCEIKHSYVDLLLSKAKAPLLKFYERDLGRYTTSS
jgi:FkbM family methyltransferase